jgi:regulatory protein
LTAAANRRRRTRRPSPRKLAASALYNYALSSLGRRAQSLAELRRKLERRAVNPADIDPILERLTAAGLLGDRRFAAQFASYYAGARRFGRYRIARELRRRGVAEEFIREALEEVFPDETEEIALVRARLERRLRRHRPPYAEKVIRSAYQSLLRAGFSSAIIRRELRRFRPGPAGRRAALDDLVAEEEASNE